MHIGKEYTMEYTGSRREFTCLKFDPCKVRITRVSVNNSRHRYIVAASWMLIQNNETTSKNKKDAEAH